MSSRFAAPRGTARYLFAFLMATVSASVLTPAGAQVALAQERAAAMRYSIPAGPLPQALNRLADISGIQLVYDAGATRALRTGGFSGQGAATDVLSALLSGTGLTWRSTGASSVTIENLTRSGGDGFADGSTVLDTITVQGQSAITEGSGSYTSGESATSTRLGLSLRETPQSATVVTRQRIDDQAMTSMEDIIDNTTGLFLIRGGGERPEIFARGGFTVSTVMYDGIPTSFSGDYAASPDLAMYDRVEVLRGANGLMQGSGQPSAGINFVRKTPTADRQIILKNSLGSWRNYRTELDASGSFNDSGSVRGRFVGAYNDKDSFRDFTNNKHGLLYGIIEADLTEYTTLTIGGSYKNEDNDNFWAGMPVNSDGSHLNLPRSTYFGNDWDYWDKETKSAFLKLEHEFENGWKLKASAEKSWSEMNYTGSYIQNYYGTFDVRAGEYWGTYDTSSYDLSVSGPVSLLDREHDLVFGVSRREITKSLKGGEGIIDTDIDPYNWDRSAYDKPDFGIMYSNSEITKQNGAYATARLNPHDALKIILGARLDWFDYNAPEWSTSYSVDGNLTKYAGIVYDVNDSHSVYASYTDIFEPQDKYGFNSEILKPIVGENYEIGVKGEYLGGALNANLAFFLIDSTNRAQLADDQAGCPLSQCYEAAGLVRSKGVEFELNGAITDNWQLGVGYTFTDARYKNDANLAGKIFDTDYPRHTLRLATSYKFEERFEGLRVGASVNWRSGAYNEGVYNGTAWRIERGSDYVLNLMAGYKISEKADLQLNVNNLFDRKYYHTIATTPMYGPIDGYGEPRNFKLTLTSKF